ncbi:hypothetical protein HYW55_04780 [Candidatus Gottesmanbacteria bacterium]|nr:hypothetical protein [Candidatus Gottesmanbacteria bacterium]
MVEIDENARIWEYLSPNQKGLIKEGLFLLHDITEHPRLEISDYSYVVFPFAKAYEGFLKQLFLDCSFITKEQYGGDHFRIGRALNPHLEKHLRWESIYDKVVEATGDRILADRMWSIWKQGRNLVFHYFPHNFRALSFSEAESIIQEILRVMDESIVELQTRLPRK